MIYHLVKKDNPLTFQKDVNNYLREGWQPHGSFIALPHADMPGSFWYFQTLIKREK